jgi:hypothetical protein
MLRKIEMNMGAGIARVGVSRAERCGRQAVCADD